MSRNEQSAELSPDLNAALQLPEVAAAAQQHSSETSQHRLQRVSMPACYSTQLPASSESHLSL